MRPNRYYTYGPDRTKWTCELGPGEIIAEAFGRIKPSEISGASWIFGERYDVQAIYPQGTPVATV